MNACIVLTRPEGRNEALAARLESAGHRVLCLPALDISALPADGPAIRPPGDYDLVVFVSGNAVRFYLDRLSSLGMAAEWPRHTLAATVGAASAERLRRAAAIPRANILHPDPSLQNQDSEALWSLLAPRATSIRRALIVRGVSGREWLGARLEQAGAQVERLAVYDRKPAVWSAEQGGRLAAALAGPAPCLFLLTSNESLGAVHANIVRMGMVERWAQSRFVVIHERVASRLQSILRASGKVEPPMVKLSRPTDDALFEALSGAASLRVGS